MSSDSEVEFTPCLVCGDGVVGTTLCTEHGEQAILEIADAIPNVKQITIESDGKKKPVAVTEILINDDPIGDFNWEDVVHGDSIVITYRFKTKSIALGKSYNVMFSPSIPDYPMDIDVDTLEQCVYIEYEL